MVLPEGAPARLGRYELIARLATGGMGEIFLARLEGAAGFAKLFVIKRILPHLADDVRFRGMLIAEARIASVMAHPNICQVYELGETEGQLYIVMEYLEGITMLPLLHRMSKEGRSLELGFVGGVIQQAIDGLHYAHELKDRSGEYLGIVHRDVTPSNIFLTDAGIAKVLDFGIAKVKDASAHTQTGTVKGKYAYMAPEQLRGGSVDRRADVFALGIVLFEMLALRRLFQRKTDYLTFRAVMEQPIPDIRYYRPECPPSVAIALARALDRDPAQRFATARQLGNAVLDAVSQHQRPWTQSEIGDFVTANFADDIQKRGAQIASAVLTSPGTLAEAMPVIIRADEEEGSTEDEFPPVDSAVIGRAMPTPEPPPPPPSPASPSPSQRMTSPQSVIATGEQPSVVMVSPRRSLVWPLVAFAMVAVAGGALYLVWQKSQEPRQTFVFQPGAASLDDAGVFQLSKPQPGTGSAGSGSAAVVAVDASVADRTALPFGSAASPGRAGLVDRTALPFGSAASPGRAGLVDERNAAPVSGAGSAAGAAHRTEKSPTPRPPLDSRVVGELLGRPKVQLQLGRCVNAHGKIPPATSLVMLVASNGRPRSFEFTPAQVGASPLGACLEAALKQVEFPRGDDDREVTLNLSK